MTTKYVKFCLPYRLPCANATRKDVIMCLQSADLIVQPDPACLTPVTTIDGEICQAYNLCDSCTQIKWNYTVSYDDAQLTNPTTPLIAGDIVGVFCRDCETDWVEQTLSCVIQPLPCVTDTATIDLGFDEGACLTADVKISANANNELTAQADGLYAPADPEYPVANETDLIYAIANSLNMVIWGTVTLTANRTIVTSVRVIKGGSFVTSGSTLTINGPFSSGAFQCFDTSGAEVVFGPSSTLYALTEWFGAVGDGTTDDTAAIQLACDRSVVIRVPVIMLFKTYAINSINVPARCVIQSDAARTEGAIFKGLSAVTMFVCPSAYSENYITFRGGIGIDGNNVATVGIDVAGATGMVLDQVNFRYLTSMAIKMMGNSGGLAYFTRLRFAGTIPTICQIGEGALQIHFDECMFASTTVTGIYTDSTWHGDNLNITNSTFDLVTCTYAIRLQRLNGSSPTLHSRIENNRFDGACSVANIYIGQYVTANILSNGISGISPNNIYVDGDLCNLFFNYIGSATCTFGILSRNCFAGYQAWGTNPQYVDSGIYNKILPSRFGDKVKGTTAERPATLLATGQFGYLYLDTTLDADGKPIWWNGVAWVDATGAVV